MKGVKKVGVLLGAEDKGKVYLIINKLFNLIYWKNKTKIWRIEFYFIFTNRLNSLNSGHYYKHMD